MNDPKTLTPVLVTTTNRGIYFGFAENPDQRPTITLLRAKHCYSSARGPSDDEQGNYALATRGPAEGSKIGPEIHTLRVGDVANVADCEPRAVVAWAAAKWA